MKFLLQLKLASECGMKIPTTLCSNNPEEIQLFLLKHETHGVIYRPLNKPCFTKNIGFDPCLNLAKNPYLNRFPCIFQEDIKKKHRVRVICSRDYIMAAKIRTRLGEQLMIESCRLPDGLENKIRAFMQQLGIVFGMFDFGVTNDDEYIFLEAVQGRDTGGL